MYESFKPGKLRVEVGVHFGIDTENFLGYAKDFAVQTQGTLRFAHAVEPFVEQPWIHSNILGAYTGSMVYENLQSSKKEAYNHIETVVKGLNLASKSEMNIAIGDVAEFLQADALAADCSMIMIGSARRGKDYKLLPTGLSTALTLMSHAKVPVLVVPESRTQYKLGKRLRMVYMDDLSESSRSALHVAIEMATGLGEIDFLHLNICPTNRKKMEATQKQMLQLMHQNKVPFDKSLLEGDVIEKAEENLMARLESRLGAAKLLLDSNQCSYERKVLFGPVGESMAEAVKFFGADVVLFGRHELIHPKPLGFGKVPFSSMLSLDVPILIAPPWDRGISAEPPEQ